MGVDAQMIGIGEIIGIPVEQWPGKCFEIADAIVETGLVEGEAVYGHWTGPVSPKCALFYERFLSLGFVQHGWIVRKDGTVVDPTRWVFEGEEPYIFEGRKTKKDWPYDEGGNAFRDLLQSQRPRPKYAEGRPMKFEVGDAEVRKHLELLVPTPRWTLEQIVWVANLRYDLHGTLVWRVYKAIEAHKLKAAIPLDNYRRAEREMGQ